MADGLFAEAPAAAAVPADQTTGRRTKLFPWDPVAAQLFEPHGESALDTVTLKQMWEAAAKGNKRAAYHSHLCADQATDGWHVGAGIFMTAASLLAAIKHFRTPEMKKLINTEFYEKADSELKDLEPMLHMLSLGKGSQSQKDTGSFRAAKRQKATAGGVDSGVATEADIMKAAKGFHEWRSKPKSSGPSAPCSSSSRAATPTLPLTARV